jgi:hypothetical protein
MPVVITAPVVTFAATEPNFELNVVAVVDGGDGFSFKSLDFSVGVSILFFFFSYLYGSFSNRREKGERRVETATADYNWRRASLYGLVHSRSVRARLRKEAEKSGGGDFM